MIKGCRFCLKRKSRKFWQIKMFFLELMFGLFTRFHKFCVNAKNTAG